MYCKALKKQCGQSDLLYCKEHCFQMYRYNLMTELKKLSDKNKQLKDKLQVANDLRKCNLDLLEACKSARDYLQFNKGNASPIFDQLEQAIAKAKEV